MLCSEQFTHLHHPNMPLNAMWVTSALCSTSRPYPEYALASALLNNIWTGKGNMNFILTRALSR